MTRVAPGELPGACAGCLRRSWLLSALSPALEYRSRDRGRLIELLALGDDDLLSALAGRRRDELRALYETFDPDELRRDPREQTLCHHRHGYPRALNGPAGPRMLNVAGGTERLCGLTAGPVVAILGSRRASDYGIEMARSLGRGLAASGVTVTGSLVDGIAVAAHAGALEARAGTVAVMGGGLAVACPARRRSLYGRLMDTGCAVSELPCDCRGRRWGGLASERIVVGLARLSVVVEAEDTAEDLAAARIAQALGGIVAAIPGRVTSPLSRGAHALLMDGAHLLRGPEDALELLFDIGDPPPRPRSPAAGALHAQLERRLNTVLERVGAGADTPDKLASEGTNPGELLLALSELELMGLLRRGDGGRYVPCPSPSRGSG
jgi:DNA processing protein